MPVMYRLCRFKNEVHPVQVVAVENDIFHVDYGDKIKQERRNTRLGTIFENKKQAYQALKTRVTLRKENAMAVVNRANKLLTNIELTLEQLDD